MWSIVCSPFLHPHVLSSIILNLCKYDLMLPWPVLLLKWLLLCWCHVRHYFNSQVSEFDPLLVSPVCRFLYWQIEKLWSSINSFSWTDVKLNDPQPISDQDTGWNWAIVTFTLHEDLHVFMKNIYWNEKCHEESL
jgi:hypothetical protein